MVKINPIKAIISKYSRVGDYGIHELNDDCYGICAAFSGTDNMDRQCVRACEHLIESKKREMHGVGSCDHQVPYPPLVLDITPRYVPILIKNGYTHENAKTTCVELCKGSLHTIECEEKCTLDHDAIVREDEHPPSPPPRHHKKKFPIMWISISVLLVIVLILLLKTSRF
jgi:hypothetical protein